MSFSAQAKREICKTKESKKCCRKAMCYGMLLFGNKFNRRNIRFVTENNAVADMLEELLLLVEGLDKNSLDITVNKKGNGSITQISLKNAEDCQRVFEDFLYLDNGLSLKINRALFENDCCVKAFIKGVFLSCGAVTSPEKDYHLEFTVPFQGLCLDLCKLVSELEEAPINLKVVMRRGVYVAYCKDSEKISDFLVYVDAGMSAMEIIQKKIYKEVVNKTNRQINSEIANINKTIEAAAVQIDAIKKIEKQRGLESLPDELKEVALLRLENPEMALSDMAKALSIPISRSGINHRLKRLIKLAEDL